MMMQILKKVIQVIQYNNLELLITKYYHLICVYKYYMHINNIPSLIPFLVNPNTLSILYFYWRFDIFIISHKSGNSIVNFSNKQ